MKGLKKILVGAVLVVTTQLYAQPADPTTPPADGTAPAPLAPGLSAKLSPTEMSTRATELEAIVRADDRHVLHLQALARKDKDVIKLTCVNDKYVRLKAESNVFDAQKRDLLSSLERDSRVVSFDAMSVAADGVHKAREEAERCMGEPELGDSESKNSFTPPDITDDPTKGTSFDVPGGTFEPPAYASPYS